MPLDNPFRRQKRSALQGEDTEKRTDAQVVSKQLLYLRGAGLVSHSSTKVLPKDRLILTGNCEEEPKG